MFKAGDRIELIYMPDDPDPIPAGTRGTVIDCSHISLGGGTRSYWQVGVKWDNGRSLQLCVPPDSARIVEG